MSLDWLSLFSCPIVEILSSVVSTSQQTMDGFRKRKWQDDNDPRFDLSGLVDEDYKEKHRVNDTLGRSLADMRQSMDKQVERNDSKFVSLPSGMVVRSDSAAGQAELRKRRIEKENSEHKLQSEAALQNLEQIKEKRKLKDTQGGVTKGTFSDPVTDAAILVTNNIEAVTSFSLFTRDDGSHLLDLF